MLRSAAVAVAVLLGVLASPAQGRPHRSKLVLTKLSGLPSQLAPGAAFTARGKVTARRARARKVTLTIALAGEQHLGVRVLHAVRKGRPRRFRIRAQLPSRGVGTGPHRLRVCARSARARRAHCRTSALTVSAPPTADPTPAATPTATATAVGSPAGPASDLGAETAGDRLFPALGNGGYDATGYDLALTYTPVVHTLAGSATMTARATQDLSRFSLDFQGFAVSAVTVNGGTATFARVDDGAVHKLRITPPLPLKAGTPFTVVTTYSGTPPTITDPDASGEGFRQTSDGAFVAGEPMGSQGWFPSNNHPSDKATFKLSMTVPAALTVVGNGVLLSSDSSNGARTWVWSETHPMATYLATATLGAFNVTPSTHDGLPYYDAVDPLAGVPSGVASEPDVIALFEDRFGPYPFSIAGSIVDNYPTAGYALETQTKPIYQSGLAADEATVAHELGHQWFGDSLSPARWEDIWLNEGFAEFASDLFQEDGGSTKAEFDATYAKAANNEVWTVPPAAPPTAAKLFDPAIYERGAACLAALRLIVGDPAFFDILRTWVAEHAYGNVTTSQFIDLVKARSGKDPARIAAFFQDWLYDADKPAITPDSF